MKSDVRWFIIISVSLLLVVYVSSKHMVAWMGREKWNCSSKYTGDIYGESPGIHISCLSDQVLTSHTIPWNSPGKHLWLVQCIINHMWIFHASIPCVPSSPQQREVASVGEHWALSLQHWLLYGGPASSLSPLNLLLVLSPQPQLCVLIPGHLSCLLCHRGPGDVDPSVSAQSTGCAEDSRDLQLPALWHQR